MASLPTIPHQQDLSLDLSHLTLEERQQAHDTASGHALTHKPDVHDLRRASEEESRHPDDHPSKRFNSRQSEESGRAQVKRSRLEQPLPQLPRDSGVSNVDGAHREKTDSGVGSDFGTIARDNYIIHDSPTPINLSEHMNLSNTVQTHVHETIAPAVTHNTIIENHHEIRHEIITREIHHHHIYHRILPVIDYEVLPARHFIPTRSGALQEISADVLPPGSNEKAQMAIHHAVSQLLPYSSLTHSTASPSAGQGEILQPRRFSARAFPGVEGDFKEYTTADGVHHTEQWWVHPPTLEQGARESGQTLPFHLGAELEDTQMEETGHESYHTATAGHRSSLSSAASASIMSAQFPLPPRNPLREERARPATEVLPIRV